MLANVRPWSLQRQSTDGTCFAAIQEIDSSPGADEPYLWDFGINEGSESLILWLFRPLSEIALSICFVVRAITDAHEP